MYLKTLFIINLLALINFVHANENIVFYDIINFSIPNSLTDEVGNINNGRDIALSRKGNCLACHEIPMADDIFHGNIGPSLAGVGNRYTIAELRLRLVNPYVLNPDSVMPAFYKVRDLKRVDKNFREKTILTAQEIEDVINWLFTLKTDKM